MEEIIKEPERASQPPEGTSTGSAAGEKGAKPSWALPAVAGVLAGSALTVFICSTPVPARTFVALAAAAGALVVGGLVTLIVIIPAVGSNPDVKTEFYSARAAYLCVVAGLMLLGAVAVGGSSHGGLKAITFPEGSRSVLG